MTELNLDELPAALHAAVAGIAQRIDAAGPEQFAAILTSRYGADFARLLATSEFAANVLLRWPQHAQELLAERRLEAGAAVVSTVVAEAGAGDPAFAAALRRVRQREMLAIAWRDLCGYGTTRDTLADVSELAESLLVQTSDYALAALCAEQKIEAPVAPPLLVAMGKLGGRELNFSSDIDLVFLHPAGESPGSEFYCRHARRVIALLDERTSDGFVFRMDARLRPFGTSGAISLSLGAFENYLQAHARGWERYAYIKARAVSGRDADRARLADALRNFCYRRYLDYGMLDSLREMKGLIEQEVVRSSRADNIKRGNGGIREIEFIAQALQIIRGGRDVGLQTQSLLGALRELSALGHLDSDSAGELEHAYLFLRKLENRLQMWRDAQTHSLPIDELERLRLALAMDCADWPQLKTQIDAQRATVATHFAELLRRPEEPATERGLGYRLWHAMLSSDRAAAALADLDIAQPQRLLDALARLKRARSIEQLDRPGRNRVDMLVPLILDAVCERRDGGLVFARCVEIIEGVGRRSAYFSLLIENPLALRRMIDLCARSATIASQVAANPLLLDSLIDPSVVALASREERAHALLAQLEAVEDDDLEHLTEVLARFKHTSLFEVALADLGSELPIMKVSDHLTYTAEAVVEQILRVARRYMRARYGVPQHPSAARDEFCVVAYGKLGGRELGYGSDLDLVFIYDCGSDDPPTSGPRVVAGSVYYARLVQRIANVAGAPTRFGSLYQVDMRLRPSGKSGALVTNFDAFARYQQHSAWTWEHQALLRARSIGGDESLQARFETLRREILVQPRDQAALKTDIVAMRERTRSAKNKGDGDRIDLKQVEGGLMDAEFLVQYWLLANASQHPELVEHSDHMRQIDALVASGVLAPGDARAVQSAYLAFRNAAHHLALAEEPAWFAADAFAAERAAIQRLWQATFDGS